VEFRGFFLVERVREAPRIQPGVPHGLTGIDVADASDARLVEEELF
jgi:hypothetical protein